MIARVIKTGNDMVMAFDTSGRELPEFQGPYDLVRERVLAAASADTVFQHWFGADEAPVMVQSSEW